MSMMSPETYFNENFKGKSKKEQKVEIKKLEKEIKELEKSCDLPIKPSPILRLNVTKMYLDYAQNALSNNIEVESVKEFTLNDVFTIENKNDPFWENEAKRVVEELEHCLSIMSIYNGSPMFFNDIIDMLKNKSIVDLETLFKKENIQLPEAPKAKEAILQIIIDKVSKIL